MNSNLIYNVAVSDISNIKREMCRGDEESQNGEMSPVSCLDVNCNMFDTNDNLSCDRDALSDLALHFLNKMKIMVVKEVEREDIEFICKVSDSY